MKDIIKQMQTKLGAHFPYLKELQLYGVISDAIQIGANSGSFHLSNPKTFDGWEQDLSLVTAAHKLAKKNHLELKNFIVHSPTIGNLADYKNDEMFNNTVNAYIEDLKKIAVAEMTYYTIEPGKAKDKQLGIEQIAKGINLIHNETRGDKTIILLETMTTKGDWIGGTFEELAQIIELVKDKDRIGVCMDTSHVWAQGYDIADNLRGVINEFDTILGIGYLKAFHINDSKVGLGELDMRHEDIGVGKIGEFALKEIVNHRKFKNLPKTLETPLGSKKYTKWKEEVELLCNCTKGR